MILSCTDIGFEDHAEILFTINGDAQRFFKVHVTNVFILISRGMGIEKFQIVIAFVDKWIDRKITNPKRGQVLEKMGTLAGIDAVMFQPRLHDQAR